VNGPDVGRGVDQDLTGHQSLQPRVLDQPFPDPAEAHAEGRHDVGERHALLGPPAAGLLRGTHVGQPVLAHRPQDELGVRPGRAPEFLGRDMSLVGVEVDASLDLLGDVGAELVDGVQQLRGERGQLRITNVRRIRRGHRHQPRCLPRQ
jgi:hypothetical protein